MKIRTGFVGNSSTASFIIKFQSSLPFEYIEKYIKKCDDYVEKEWDEGVEYSLNFNNMTYNHTREPYRNNLSIDNNIYSLNQYTTMFNDWGDINCWKFIRALSENRIKDVKLLEIIKTEEEYCDLNLPAEYDPKPWNYDYAEDHEEVNKRLEHDNLEYLEYLKTIDQITSDDEIVEITMYLLKK